MLSYEGAVIYNYIFDFQRLRLVHFEKEAYKYPEIKHFEFKSLRSNGKISINALGRQISRDLQFAFSLT